MMIKLRLSLIPNWHLAQRIMQLSSVGRANAGNNNSAFINLDPDATARSRHLRLASARSLLASPLSQAVARSRDLDRVGTRSSLTTSFSRLKGVAAGVVGCRRAT
ncbi:hypothetical protein PIB30_079898, partial [Stylosanthes scabra]|nr:hypothetical protein [Stylosanthes scabra]